MLVHENCTQLLELQKLLDQLRVLLFYHIPTSNPEALKNENSAT